MFPNSSARDILYACACFTIASTSFGASHVQDCASLFETPLETIRLHEGKRDVFVARWGQEISVFKIDLESVPKDLELADQVFTASASKIFRANPSFAVTVPSKKLPLYRIPADARRDIERMYGKPPYKMMRSAYVTGRAPMRIPPYGPSVSKDALEEHRVFHAEAQRIFNWVRSNNPTYQGIPIEASLLVDTADFSPQNRASRYRGFRTKGYRFRAGENEFGLFLDENIIIQDQQYVLIDPH